MNLVSWFRRLVTENKKNNLRIKAFTLVEILVVLAITSVVLLFNYSIAMSLSKGFISSSASKALLEFIRTTKQLAILNTENYNEFLMGMGVKFVKESNGTDIVRRLKYRTSGVYTFLSYQDPTNSSSFIELPQDSYNFLRIPNQVTLSFYTDNTHTPVNCNGDLLLIFESLFGKPHLYCVVSENTINVINFNKIIIHFTNYQNKIIINQNGEVYGTFK